MRPLVHPSMEDVTLEGVLHALSDPVRVGIYVDIARSGQSPNCATYLTCGGQTVPKSTLSQHFKVLREAGLIRSERQGVECLNRTRCAELNERFPGLIPAIMNAHQVQKAQMVQRTSGARKTPRSRSRR